MSDPALRRLRDQLLAAPDEMDARDLPPGFEEARVIIRDAIARIAASGIADQTFAAALMSETLPRMIHDRGPGWVAAMLHIWRIRLAQEPLQTVPDTGDPRLEKTRFPIVVDPESLSERELGRAARPTTRHLLPASRRRWPLQDPSCCPCQASCTGPWSSQ